MFQLFPLEGYEKRIHPLNCVLFRLSNSEVFNSMKMVLQYSYQIICNNAEIASSSEPVPKANH